MVPDTEKANSESHLDFTQAEEVALALTWSWGGDCREWLRLALQPCVKGQETRR